MNSSRGRTVAIVQARMTSQRLPGKVLLPLGGAPMIVRQLERIQRARSLDLVVVATSTDLSDDELARVVTEAGFLCVRGSLTDVLDRYVQAMESTHADVVVRLTGDCPLTCPEVIDAIVARFHEANADYVSNTLQPTYPDGLDVEVVNAATLLAVARESTDVHEREHVTLGVYRRGNRFSLENFVDPHGRDNSTLRWTVDNPEDFAFVSEVYRRLDGLGRDFSYQDVLDLVELHPELSRTHEDSRRNAALDGLDTGAMHHRGKGT